MWQEGAKQQRAKRCLMSVYVSVLVCVATLVAVSITAVWVPSAMLANDELVTAGKGQLLSSVEQVSKELLGYFQVASSHADVIGTMYNMSFAAAPASAPKYFMDGFGAGAWSLLKQARNESLLSSTAQPCNTDVALLSATYKANLNYETTGTDWDGNVTALELEATDEAPAGKARMNLIMGDGDIADPLKFRSTMFFKDCSAWLGGGENLWRMQNLPGDWSSRDSGVREPVWLPGTVVAGSGSNQALYKKVFFPLEGPSWADKSAFGAISVRVGSSTITGDSSSTVSVQDILQQVAEQTEGDTLLFVLTADGELLATSSGDQQVELRGPEGELVGLLPGDSDDVQDPFRPVARALLASHCSSDAGDGVRQCDWSSVAPMQEISGYYVSAKFMSDPQAANLNMVLVNMVSLDVVGQASKELNTLLGITSVVIQAFACVFALILSRTVSKPFLAARDSMFLLGDMRAEDALQRNTETNSRCRWSFTEVSDLRMSFFHAATCLRDWREHEMDRRAQLEEERNNMIHKTVEKAVRGAGKLVHPMVLISADAFSKLEQLTSYEELRNSGKLVFIDTEEALASFKADNSIIFLSHQWLAWGFPDNATKTHFNAMKSAIKTASARVGANSESSRCSWNNTYV